MNVQLVYYFVMQWIRKYLARQNWLKPPYYHIQIPLERFPSWKISWTSSRLSIPNLDYKEDSCAIMLYTICGNITTINGIFRDITRWHSDLRYEQKHKYVWNVDAMYRFWECIHGYEPCLMKRFLEYVKQPGVYQVINNRGGSRIERPLMHRLFILGYVHKTRFFTDEFRKDPEVSTLLEKWQTPYNGRTEGRQLRRLHSGRTNTLRVVSYYFNGREISRSEYWER